jgi:RNA polymerase sigma factor (sigma-70 family)
LNETQADIATWNAFKQGDIQAFDGLFRRYYPLLVQYGSKLGIEKSRLEDLIQELFIEMWQSRSATPVASVKAYLLKSLKFKLFRHIKDDRNTHYSGDEDPGVFELSYDHFVIAREEEAALSNRIIGAVNKLPSRQREIIYLKIFQGLSYEEVSEVMSINYQVARNLFYQSIKSLREVLKS